MPASVTSLLSSSQLTDFFFAQTHIHDEFPRRFSLDFFGILFRVLLAFLVTVHVTILSSEFLFHAKMMDRVSNVFIGMNFPGYNAANYVVLHNSEDVSEHIEYVAHTYSNLKEYFPTSIPVATSLEMKIVKLEHQSYRDILLYPTEEFDSDTEEVYFNATEACPLGPFDLSGCDAYKNISARNMWWYTKSIETTVQLRNIHLRGFAASYRPVSMLWTMHLKYDLSERNDYIPLRWSVEVERYADSIPLSSPQVLALLSTVTVCAALCVVELTLLGRIRTLGQAKWNILQTVSVLGNTVACIAFLYVNVVTGEQRNAFDTYLRIISSFSYALSWVVLVRPLSLLPGMEGVVTVTGAGFPALVRAGVPLFLTIMGLASAGTYFFGGYYSHFNTIDKSFELMYALMVGDAIKDTFDDLYSTAQSKWVWFGVIT